MNLLPTEPAEPPTKPAPKTIPAAPIRSIDHAEPAAGTKNGAKLIVPASVQALPERASDFSWIQGPLQKVHIRGAAWTLRYAALDQEDTFGGSVILNRDSRLDSFSEGDVVRIQGEILKEKAGNGGRAPLYRVQRVTLVQKASEANP